MADYRNLVKKSVRKAFKQVGTLAKDILFTAGQPQGFDFNAGEVIENSSTQLVLKGIITDSKKKRDEGKSNCITQSVTMMAEDVPNLNSYDRVTIDSVVWNVVHPIKNDGFVVTFEITKEI